MICPTPLTVPDPGSESKASRISVPCGRCGACRHNRRTMWTFRLKQEEKDSISSHFITLTYEDTHLPTTPYGEVTLEKKDLQKFIKRLRKENAKHTDLKLRYYAVGEYGTKTQRPHYHAVAYNLMPDTIHTLHRTWCFGFHTVDPLNQARMHYVTKFHVNANDRDSTDRIPEFATMSRRPGLGLSYIVRNGIWHEQNGYSHVILDGYSLSMPRYYREKIFSLGERRWQNWENRKISEKNHNQELKRLSRLKVENPEDYIFHSQLIQAKKVQDKANKNDKF